MGKKGSGKERGLKGGDGGREGEEKEEQGGRRKKERGRRHWEGYRQGIIPEGFSGHAGAYCLSVFSNRFTSYFFHLTHCPRVRSTRIYTTFSLIPGSTWRWQFFSLPHARHFLLGS